MQTFGVQAPQRGSRSQIQAAVYVIALGRGASTGACLLIQWLPRTAAHQMKTRTLSNNGTNTSVCTDSRTAVLGCRDFVHALMSWRPSCHQKHQETHFLTQFSVALPLALQPLSGLLIRIFGITLPLREAERCDDERRLAGPAELGLSTPHSRTWAMHSR